MRYQTALRPDACHMPLPRLSLRGVRIIPGSARTASMKMRGCEAGTRDLGLKACELFALSFCCSFSESRGKKQELSHACGVRVTCWLWRKRPKTPAPDARRHGSCRVGPLRFSAAAGRRQLAHPCVRSLRDPARFARCAAHGCASAAGAWMRRSSRLCYAAARLARSNNGAFPPRAAAMLCALYGALLHSPEQAT